MIQKTNKLYMKTILENVDSKMVQQLHNAHKVTVYAAFVSIFFIISLPCHSNLKDLVKKIPSLWFCKINFSFSSWARLWWENKWEYNSLHKICEWGIFYDWQMWGGSMQGNGQHMSTSIGLLNLCPCWP